jgi:4-hydroxy-tetrahydrodipicolinate synthase
MDGVWLPLITPFLDHEVDFPSFERLLEHYGASGIAGLILGGTTECRLPLTRVSQACARTLDEALLVMSRCEGEMAGAPVARG